MSVFETVVDHKCLGAHVEFVPGEAHFGKETAYVVEPLPIEFLEDGPEVGWAVPCAADDPDRWASRPF